MKPPKRIRVIIDCHGNLFFDDGNNSSLITWDEEMPLEAPHSEHFYTLEEKEPMEPKKEMTAKDAWIAMAKGECVSCSDVVHTIKGRQLVYFSTSGDWTVTYEIYVGPYSIVPDPSVPEPKVDEYNESRLRILATEDDFAEELLTHMDRFFVRKP